MGSDDGVQHSELLSLWTLSIVQYSKKLENTNNLHILFYISFSSGYALS
jgi:hypothetical protein